jgi:hypothetical protein
VSVLFVGGVIRSGSTLLHRILGELPGFVCVGELTHLWRYSLPHDHDCGCGQPFSGCPFWSEVGERAFGGWQSLDAEDMLRLQLQVERTKHIPKLLAPRAVPGFSAELERYTGVLARLYRAIAEVAGATRIVDSSKHPATAYVLRKTDVDFRVVRIVRDPRGVAYSCSKTVPRPEHDTAAGDYMEVWPTRRIARNWVTTNSLIAALSGLGVPQAVLRYEDLIRDPAVELSRALARIGWADLDVGTVVRGGQAHLTRSHTLDGNPMRFSTGAVPLEIDEQWRAGLGQNERRTVELITWPMRVRYGYGAGAD